MKIKKISSYKDGGTIEIDTNDGIYCIDCRLKTTTKGIIFKGYPEKDNGNMIEEQDNVKSNILEALSEYNVNTFFDWKPRVYELLNVL